MKRCCALILGLLIASVASAQQSRTWTGNWNNRKFGTSGPLKCVASETASGRWEGVFTGTFRGDPFEFKAVFQSKANRNGAQLSGKATIRGHRYQWNGTLNSRQLRGKYTSSVGYNGEFILNETGGAMPNQTAPKQSIATSPSSWPAAIDDGERMLFIGNSYMANEGGVFHYFAKAVQKDQIDITSDQLIYYGRSLRQMMKPEVGRALSSNEYDSVVITSGPVDVMKQYDSRIQESGKKTIVFMTWEGRHPGHQADESRYTAATKQTVAEMRRMERDTGAVIVPAAVVFHDLTVRPPEGVSRVDYLWRPGNIHQNELGTMVNAWMLYAILLGESPVGVNFDMPPYIVGQKLQQNPDMRLTRELRMALQQRVWEVAQAWKAGQTHLD